MHFIQHKFKGIVQKIKNMEQMSYPQAPKKIFLTAKKKQNIAKFWR